MEFLSVVLKYDDTQMTFNYIRRKPMVEKTSAYFESDTKYAVIVRLDTDEVQPYFIIKVSDF